MPHAGVHHGDAPLIGGGYNFVVTQTATWLDDAYRTGADHSVQTIAEGKKSIAGNYATRK